MKKATLSVLAAILSLTAQNASASFYNYYDPRLSLWGLAGVPEQARGDFLFPLAGNACNLFYADVQGSYTHPSNAWTNNNNSNGWTNHNRSRDTNYVSGGAGFRKLYEGSVLGAYLFYDRDESRLHNIYHVISPGVEGFFCNWDARINGYFPVNQRKTLKSFASQFPCDCADCVDCAQCESAVFFQGHKQFGHQYTILEQAGRGGDAEVGYTFHCLNNTQLHGGAYYFNFNTPNHSWILHDNSSNLFGVEGRLETPVNRYLALTVEASYDRLQRGALVGGLRFNPLPSKYCPTDLRSHMTDAIPRNLGTLKTGSGIPTVTAKRDEGIFLQRDNIFFFSATGGSAFVDRNSGTFENPLSNDQFSQAVVDAIGPANFYFSPGTYVISGSGVAPNANITLLTGDNIFGRSAGYLTAARGTDRPVFLGSMTLPGFNTLASIQLENIGTSTGATNASFTALNILDAPGIFLCNDNIVATSTVASPTANGPADLQPGISNLATGIFAKNSQVTMLNSTVTASAVVTGNIDGETGESPGGFNAAAAIGGNAGFSTPSANFTGNTFTISSCSMNANSEVDGTNNWDTFAVGIGGNADNGGRAIFQNNVFIINNSNVNAKATTGINGGLGFNFAAGIGSNLDGGNADFKMNNFTINNTAINSNATTNINNNNSNFSVGIGTNIGVFTSNTFTLSNNTSVNSLAVTGGANNDFNTSVGIGSIAFDSNFVGNTFKLDNTSVTANATVSENTQENAAVGIGGDFVGTFQGNSFTLSNNSNVNASARVAEDNAGGGNIAMGIGDVFCSFFGGTAPSQVNTFTLSNSNVNAFANVSGNNTSEALNEAMGIGATGGVNFIGNTFTITNLNINAQAMVAGENSNNSDNLSTGIGVGLFQVTFEGNTFNLIGSNKITSLATVTGPNAGLNSAVGIGNNSDNTSHFLLSNNTVTGLDTVTFNVKATANGNNQQADTEFTLRIPQLNNQFMTNPLAEMFESV